MTRPKQATIKILTVGKKAPVQGQRTSWGDERQKKRGKAARSA